jgi:hypothetical protein
MIEDHEAQTQAHPFRRTKDTSERHDKSSGLTIEKLRLKV